MQEPQFERRVEGRGFSVGRVTFDRNVDFARHVHELAHIVLVYSGQFLDLAERPIQLRIGEILFHPAKTVHENRCRAGSDLLIAELDRDFLSAFCSLYGDNARTFHFNFQLFDDVPEKLYEEIIRNDAPTSLVLEALLIELIAVGARALGTGPRRPDWLVRVTAYIHMHAHEQLTVARLADVGCVSLSRLSHGFREHMGKSVTRYVREYRLRVAARALRQTTRSIKDIALNYGFYDHAHFSREFTRLHGIAPIEYRRRTRQQAP